MSFPIIFYTTNSPANQVTKEFVKTSAGDDAGIVATGTLREGTSILDPVIVIHPDENLQPNFIKEKNYMWIEQFGRYYYITNIVSPYNGLWEIHGHVDVLMSFKDAIREQVAVVARQEKKYNLMLDDGFFMTYQNPKIQTKLFSVEGPFEVQEFVLIVAGS